MKARNAHQSRPSTGYSVPQKKIDNGERKGQARRSEAHGLIEGETGGAGDRAQITLPERGDKPWLVVGIAAAFAVIFAVFFFTSLK